MKSAIKKIIKKMIRAIVRTLNKLTVGRVLLTEIANEVMNTTYSLQYQGCELKFTVPNNLNYFRVTTFATKEPETLEWIDCFASESIVWDIGANVGLYTCYAAKARFCTVFAFEPSVFNLELLARNIQLNNLTKNATIIPLPLSDALNISTLNMTTTEWGGALSTFGQDYGHDGKALDKKFEFSIIGLSMADLTECLKIPYPDYIKMDVDGLEHLILKGGSDVLKQVKGVLIEINDDFQKQSLDSPRYLTEAGLVLKEKRHSELLDNSPLYGSSYNQIWYRPN